MAQTQRLQILNAQKMRVWEEAKAFLDRVEARGKDMNSEERRQWDRYNARIDALDAECNEIAAEEERADAYAHTREVFDRQYGTNAMLTARQREEAGLRKWARGEGPAEREFDFTAAIEIDRMRIQGASPAEVAEYRSSIENRVMNWDTGSLASGVPTTTSIDLYQLMQASFAALALPTRKIMTTSGEQMKFPRINAHSIATQVSGQGTLLAGTDPTFLSMTMDAWKYGELVRISNEALSDAAFDVAGFLAADIARAVGRQASADFSTGTGSGQPQGFTTAALVGSNGTIATGGTLITPTYENLVDLVYSINSSYRNSGAAAWAMRDLVAAQIRKLRDQGGGTLGAALWQPSQTVGISGAEPGALLGYPVFTDANMASCASNAKVAVFGDWQAYYIRMVGSLVIERDASRYFDTDETGFRGKWRLDGDCIDLTALNILKQSVT